MMYSLCWLFSFVSVQFGGFCSVVVSFLMASWWLLALMVMVWVGVLMVMFFQVFMVVFLGGCGGCFSVIFNKLV